MLNAQEILKTAYRDAEEVSFDLLYSKQQNIPGSVLYDIRRYFARHPWVADDTGILEYHYEGKGSKENYLKLKFCTTGNKICEDKPCGTCKQLPTANCNGQHHTVDVFLIHFTAGFLKQFTDHIETTSLKDEVLAFKYQESFTKVFTICQKKRNILDDLLNNSYTGAMQNIFINARIQELLLQSVGCIVNEKSEVFECKFLSDDYGKERIYSARDILLQRIGNPITIKELSRKVAINECYLKKGFKEVFGMTIFEFYQQQRMEHAKYLLHEKGLSVTEASVALGYSSIAHFSTAFKKQTGIKPCELLN